MSDFPIQIIIFPVIGVVLVVFFVFYRKRATAQYDQQYASFRAGELAQRLRLTLTAGDPAFNLFVRHANADIARGPADGRPIHIEVRMEGAPDGVPLALHYLYRVEQETGFTEVRWTTWFDCRMSARAKQAFPRFEVISRSAPLGPIAQTLGVPAVPTGDPVVDATYSVHTDEPEMARLLAGLLPGFATFVNSGIHVVGDGTAVHFIMKQDKAPLLPNALFYAEGMAANLTSIARAVGG
jgi:hypothetical protein